ncbi:MAG TPA: sugar ABC transporter permease [Tepidisphaeraceae bacterium]|nr:sugar ABC transporter permease [Tepidisphaeraceae bacterium]
MPAISARGREALKGYAFIAPWLVGFCTFTLIPIGLSLYYSFCDYSLLQRPVFRGLENYRTLASDGVFWKAMGNTFYYAALSLPLCAVAALSAALLLNAKVRGQAVYRTIVFLPSIVPAVASAMLWLWLFNPKLGLINFALGLLGVSEQPGWLGSERWAMPALVLISIWGAGNTVVIYLAGLQDVPRELYEAAELDGAGALRRVWHVTLPMLSPVIFFNLIMAMIGAMQVFVLPLIMTQGGPARSTYFFTYYLYDNAFVYLKMGYASAMAWVQLLIVLALTALAFWTSKRWVHHSAA